MGNHPLTWIENHDEWETKNKGKGKIAQEPGLEKSLNTVGSHPPVTIEFEINLLSVGGKYRFIS